MCLAVPFRITEINEKEGIGERNGIRRSIRLDFIKEPKIGDYVIVHAGFAIERLPKEQAENSMGAAAEVEEELRKIMEEMA